MKIVLKKKPVNATIIEGFPGFGLVGTVTTEYLVNELKAEPIGYIQADDIPPMIAIHDNKIVQPIGIYHDPKNNLVILHVMTNVKGIEWRVGEILLELAKRLEAKEIVSIEGVGSPTPSEKVDAYFYSNFDEGRKRFGSFKVQPLKEGIILGVTATLLLLAEEHKFSSIFVETHSSLPDSKAAAKAVEMLDKYLNLKIDYAPLMKQAEQFEAKVKKLLEQGELATEEQKKKNLSYVG